MLIIVRPGFSDVNIGVWMVVGATVIGATCRLMTKSLIRTDSAATIVLYLSITVTVLTFVPALFVWTWLSLEQWLLFIAIGMSGSATHWLSTEALKHGDVTVMEPIAYTRLVWAAIFGIVVFGQVPGLATWVGGVIIIVGAMLLLRVETMEKRRNSKAEAAH